MNIAVIGLGQFGLQLAVELEAQGHEVLAVDSDERVVESIKDRVAQAIIADATDIASVKQLGMDSFGAVFVAIGEDFSASLMITGHLQDMGVRNLHCRVINPMHERILKLMKVENLVYAETLAARQIAKRIGIRGATRHFGLSQDYSIVELHVPEFLIGKRLKDSDLRGRFAVNLVTVKRGDDVTGVPAPDLIFSENDELVLFGSEKAIKAFSVSRK